MFLKDQNYCHYCLCTTGHEGEFMVCEPCGLVKYCNETCQYNDSYKHNELCMTVKRFLKEWYFYRTMSQQYQESVEHEHDGIRSLEDLISICRKEMLNTNSKLAGERTLEFCQELQYQHEKLCNKYEISGFAGFYTVFDTYLCLGKVISDFCFL